MRFLHLKKNKKNTEELKQIGLYEISPRELIKKFGLPLEGDKYKVSGEYIFISENGDSFTLYDWKSTSLYERDYLDPLSFWRQENPYMFCVGGTEEGAPDIEDFKQWIKWQ